MKQLKCEIISIEHPQGFESPNYKYAVFDDKEIVATGVSSSLSWVRHDASGYHTKKDFDALYPDGWNVNFDF